jgi:hypothetical protein
VVGWLPGVDVPWQVAVPPSAKLEMFKDSRIKNDRAVPIYLLYEWGQVINPLPVAPAWLLEDIRTRPRQTQGGQARGGTYGHPASELPATELFLERGLGWFTGSRDFDCFKSGRRLWGQYGDEATVVAFIYEAWKRTPPKDHPFSWQDAHHKIKQAERYWRADIEASQYLTASLTGWF